MLGQELVLFIGYGRLAPHALRTFLRTWSDAPGRGFCNWTQLP
jgi:hypothetical protein